MPLPDTLTAVDVGFSNSCDAPGTGEDAIQDVFARALQTLLNNTYYLKVHGLGASITEADLRTAAAALTAALAINGKNITGMADPVNPQDGATKNYVDTVGATSFDLSLTPGTDNSIGSPIAIPDNTILEIVMNVTVRDTGTNIHSAYHSQKWGRFGGGTATLVQSNDPVQVNGIPGITSTASRILAAGSPANSVQPKFNPGAVTTHYIAKLYTLFTPLAHA